MFGHWNFSSQELFVGLSNKVFIRFDLVTGLYNANISRFEFLTADSDPRSFTENLNILWIQTHLSEHDVCTQTLNNDSARRHKQ